MLFVAAGYKSVCDTGGEREGVRNRLRELPGPVHVAVFRRRKSPDFRRDISFVYNVVFSEVCAVVCPAIAVDNVMYCIVEDFRSSRGIEFFDMIRYNSFDTGGGPGLGKVNAKSLRVYKGLEVN